MIESYAFKTRARTVDHLGREQIADCPTAISELWKNAYDAYAKNVSLVIFEDILYKSREGNLIDESPVIASLLDDGHGMSKQEFFDKWLVIGTESKASGDEVSIQDRKGLNIRVKQGQKGIGRLSTAALGPLLLLISKRVDQKFVAALIDWRIFENPFLLLEDVTVPVVEFDKNDDLWEYLPSLFDELMSNLWGRNLKTLKLDNNSDRTFRIINAWERYSAQERQSGLVKTTQEKIEEVLISTTFTKEHIEEWSAWTDPTESGTALLVADVAFDLRAQLASDNTTASQNAEKQAKGLFLETLSSFIDPYINDDDRNAGYDPGEFNYSVFVKSGLVRKTLVSPSRDFSLQDLEHLEHILEGEFNDDGIFIGRIKAFGKWIDSPFILPPAGELGKRKDSRVGQFFLRIGSYEGMRSQSTMSDELHALVEEKKDEFSGLRVYRDGLRVLPYGRESNDFFEIEKRRSKKAGREFWSNRRLFGRIGISRTNNQNLKDKAGREGLIDNKAAKVFRDLVENVLMTSARRYFGEGSEIRSVALTYIQEENERKRAEEGQKALRQRQRKEFRARLSSFEPLAHQLNSDLKAIEQEMILCAQNYEEKSLLDWQDHLNEIQNKKSELKFPSGSIPRSLGTSAENYKQFREAVIQAEAIIGRLRSSLTVALKKINPDSPQDIATSRHQSHASYLQGRIRRWGNTAKKLISEEMVRLEKLINEKNGEFHAICRPEMDAFLLKEKTLEEFMEFMEKQRERLDLENGDLFSGYIDTLELMKESIGLSEVALYSVAEKEKVSGELNQIHSLAQLGITVEIVGHEMDGLEASISNSLMTMPPSCKNTHQYETIKYATRQIGDRLRFLSPLKLSGDRQFEELTGKKICNYLSEFLQQAIANGRVELKASPAFLNFSIRDLPARIYPVFVNLVNNSIYWASGKPDSLINLDVVDEKIIVSDNGPGVSIDEISQLFTLFYTTKVRGGRGVGLYLSRSNLATGGHSIYYAREDSERILSGANFVIKFVGAKYE
ncbi:ATP-binding protein [Comamonas testosteroni]|uniref:ATP-binding protein n=1 Tax=Comamonas testosteroni TaxID=285 RepID=UPI002E123743|nr:ATP-binding protein [Comamonas testosteroni]